MYLKKWGFIKNSRRPSRRPSPGPKTHDLLSSLPISFSEERTTAPIVKEQTTTRDVTHTTQLSNIAYSEEQASPAIPFMRSVEISQGRVQSGSSPMEVDSTNLIREPQHLPLLLDQYRTNEQPVPNTGTSFWHTATLDIFVKFLTSVHSFCEASSIARIFPIAMMLPQFPVPLKEEACYQFLWDFLEFEDDIDICVDFEPYTYQLVARRGQPARSPSVLPDGLLRGAEESGFAFRDYTPAALVRCLRLTLQLAMQEPVIERGHVMEFTTTLCKMVDSLIKQLHDSEGGGGPEPLADNYSNEAGAKELNPPTNNLAHQEQMTPTCLAIQLQFFAWLHQTVKRDYPDYNAEHLSVAMIEHLISTAIVIAKRNRSEKRTQIREYLSIFALGMNTGLPVILDPTHCCWLMPSLCDSFDLFNICKGRCMKYLKIFQYFERFCHDGLEYGDFSQPEDIMSKLSKDITEFKGWVAELSSNMKCPSQWWILGSETNEGGF